MTAIHPRLPAPVARPSHQQLLPAEQPDHSTSRLKAVVAAPAEQARDNLVATAVRRFGDHTCALHRSRHGDYDGCHDYDDQPDHDAPLSDLDRSTAIVPSAVSEGKHSPVILLQRADRWGPQAAKTLALCQSRYVRPGSWAWAGSRMVSRNGGRP